MKVKVCFARFPYLGQEHPDVTDWLLQTMLKASRDDRIEHVDHQRLDDTPITMTRNRAVENAKKVKSDYLVMIDSDMSPDTILKDWRPFWETSFNFMLEHRNEKPCLVAAPYVGPPPHCNPYVFQWVNQNNDDPDRGFKLEMYTREHASMMAGIQEAAALPTGLMIIDMRVFDHLEQPYFYYEWKDKSESEKASTEDVTFTRDVSLQGMPVYCNWDAWAGHWKRYLCVKPQPITVDGIREKFKKSVRDDLRANKKMIDVIPPSPEWLKEIREMHRDGLSVVNGEVGAVPAK